MPAALEAVERNDLADWEIEAIDISLRQVLRTSSDWDADLLEAYFEPERLNELIEESGASDRSYMRDAEDEKNVIGLSAMNFGALPMVNGLSRIAARFYQEEAPVAAVKAKEGSLLSPAEAMELGLVTAIPDDLDWADEIRIAIEERAALSPDATGGDA